MTAGAPVSAPAPVEKRIRGIVIDTLFLLIALSAMIVVTSRITLVMDEDIWWHLRTGHWILANHTVPVKDTFSSHAMGQPWVAYSWLFEVLVAKVFDGWGYRGMLTLTTFSALAYTAWLIVFFARFVNLRRAMILSFCCCLALMPLRSPRPWHFTIFFFAVELSLLWIARETNRPAWLLPIIPLFVLWANIHIQFVYGLGLLGLFALEESLPGRARSALGLEPRPVRRSTWLWSMLTLCLLATLINPYGWNLYGVVIHYSSQRNYINLVNDVMAMPFRSLSNWLVLLLVCAALFVLGWTRSRSLLLILLLAVGGFLGFRSQRDVWFPVIVAALALAVATRTSSPASLVQSRWTFGIAIPVSFGLTLLAMAYGRQFSDLELRQAIAHRFPEKASDYVESHKLEGPLFNSYNWGGYLMWRLPQMPVSIDGRSILYESVMQSSSNTMSGKKGWSEDPDLRRARTLILEQDVALSSVLRVDPNFRLVYEDQTAVIFQPINPPAAQ